MTITATSTADNTKLANANTVTITALVVLVSFTTAPPSSLVVSGTANVTASVSNDPLNKGVDWTVTCGSAGACGSFNPTHTASGAATVYTAPAGVPTGNTVTITATSTADNTKSISGAVTITTTTSSSKNYTFYLSGADDFPNNTGYNFVALAGVVTIDSSGNVTAGVQDYNNAFTVTSPQPAGDKINGGKLTVSASTGQGTLTLITNNTKVGVSGTETLGVQFVNTNHALIMQFDGTATSSGSMDLQTLPSTPSGGYAFTLSGVDPGYNPVALGGVFSISGAALTNGKFDVNDNGTVSTGIAFSANVSAADAFGRGTITGAFAIGGVPVVLNYYAVRPEVLRIIDVDAKDSEVGSAFGQGTGAFTNASLGSSVFTDAGSPFTANSYAAVGMFTTSNTSSSPANFSGVADNNELNNAVQSAATIAGTYSIASNGYGSLTITPGDLTSVNALGIYMTGTNLNLNDPNNTTSGLGGALVLDLASVHAGGGGVLVPQTDTSTASLAGKYAFGVQDFNNFNAACHLCEFDFVGQGSVTGGALSGTGLISDPFKTLSTSQTDSGVPFSGTLLPDATHPGHYLRFSLAFLGGGHLNMAIYQASGGQLFWLEEDNNAVSIGPIEQEGSLAGLP